MYHASIAQVLRILFNVLLLFTGLPLWAQTRAEFHGLWVDAFGPGFLTSDQVKGLAQDCRKYNFNAVIVEMRRRGDAFYTPHPPNPDPRTSVLAEDFDALAEIIHECHSMTPRIEVHCWLVSHFIWSWKNPPPQKNHIFNLHPEYLTKDSIGQKQIAKGYYLDPGHPDANQWIHDVAVDIVSRYGIDGIHWDYCRYPEEDSGYNEKAIGRYNAEFGLSGAPSPNDARFSEWRRRQVTDFLRWVNADLLEIKPALVTSISVFANYKDAFGYRFSDWAAWNREGIVDLCMPMDFSPDNDNIFIPRAEDALKHAGQRNVYLGQGAYLNTKENTLTQLNHAREAGFLGTVFYSYRSSNAKGQDPSEVFGFVKENFQPSWTTTPSLLWKTTTGIVKGTVRRGRDNLPIYNASVRLNAESGRELKTEPHGQYAYFNLTPGNYTLTATAVGYAEATQKCHIKGGEVLRLDFKLTE